MARFHGEVGYGESVETPANSGVWESQILEALYSGDILRNNRRLESGESVNNDITVGNRISIVADRYAFAHFHKIKYVRWAGETWIVTSVDVQAPRLVLNLGGIYNGPTA